MKSRFRLYRRSQSGRFYIEDNVTGKQESLRTSERSVALKLFHARNEAVRQPALNLQLARAYLAGQDSEALNRTWQFAIDELIRLKTGSTKARYERGFKDKALDSLRKLRILATQAEDFLRVLGQGSVSTNDNLRRLHNFVLDMGWLPRAVLPRKQWPPIVYGEKRAITWEEHQRLVAREKNSEFKAFLELLWEIGGSQTDVAQLKAEDIDWGQKLLIYARKKTGSVSRLRIGEELERLLRSLPSTGALFPKLAPMDQRMRGCTFLRRCKRLGIEGVTLHSYRYAWAERAKVAGYPERFAQEALGHNSKAVHRAYARKAQVTLPALEEYEKQQAERKIICLKQDTALAAP